MPRSARRIGGLVSAVLVAALATALTACAPGGGSRSDSTLDGSAHDALHVYATTGYLADVVANLAPQAVVTTMVGPGGDPHTYQPSTRDIAALQSADVVLWTGLHLEAQLSDLLHGLGDRQHAVAEALPEDLLLELPTTDADGAPLHDPHVWNSPRAWTVVVGLVAEALAAADPDGADGYRAAAEAYVERIERTAAEVAELLEAIPPERRVLVTGHDAFAYFGATFGFEVHATDVISTEAQLSAAELSALADLVVDRDVPVIFHDDQANPQAITSLLEAVHARGHRLEVADAALYADSLGAEPGVDTYLGVFRHNAEAIAAALAPAALAPAPLPRGSR